MEVVQEIEKSRVDANNKPLMDIKITGMKVFETTSAGMEDSKHKK